MSLAQLIARSGISFGTSGARGLVVDFTAEVCAAFSQSFLRVLAQQVASNEATGKTTVDLTQVAIGIDHRPSSMAMAQACAGAAKALGVIPRFFGVLPTPALAHYALRHKIPAIMVTGSHIPFDRNGLKFYRPDGEISKADEQQILACAAPLQPFTAMELVADPVAAALYLRRYQQFFAADALAGLHIGVYEHSSAGRDLYRSVFEALGATVTTLQRSDVFVPIDTEAVSAEDQAKARAWAAQYGFDAIFSTDGDGDRPLLSDEDGNWLRGDIVGLLAAKHLGIQALAVPVSCNSAIEQSQLFRNVERTRIGSPYVIEAFARLAARFDTVAGFEANGGFLLASSLKNTHGELTELPTRDALLPALAVLAASKGRGVAALLHDLPARFTASDRLPHVPTAWSQAWLQQFMAAPAAWLQPFGWCEADVGDVNQLDGLRLTLSCGDVVHLRPSGNAPELRCYVEAATVEAAQALLVKVLRVVQALVQRTLQ
ncbi:MAG TPA: phosphomannomutase [Rheinheimera sp.]|nr:phosphomannomutase [Rheinheimera sp.]